MEKLLIICGPTASGKSALAIECAKLLETEIISADSMNVYKGLDIGTAKPSVIDMQGIRHHLIDVALPIDSFSVGDYRELAMPIIKRLHSQGKIPIICGGTGFYINSLIYNLSYGETTGNLLVREKYLKLAKERGNEYVYEILKQKDFESASKIHYNDVKRVVRALEICESGIKKSDIKDDLKPIFDYSAYCIDYDTPTLYQRINSRVDQMFKDGLIEEVENLYKQGITEEYQCMQGIGYKEIIPLIKGEISIEQCIDMIKLNTRHYAKRQKTFFRKLEGLIYLEPQDNKILAERMLKNL